MIERIPETMIVIIAALSIFSATDERNIKQIKKM